MRLSVLGLLLVMTACQTREDGARQDVPATSRAPAPPDTVILETSRGRIVLELNRDKAPASVANFVRHVKAGFYDGLIFHRIAPNFVIQAGRVMEDMSERTSSAAPILNEAENGLKNIRGTVVTSAIPPLAVGFVDGNLHARPQLRAIRILPRAEYPYPD